MGTLALPFRLKTEHRKKRLRKEDLDKQLLRFDRERNRLHDNPGRIVTVPLAEPYQRGWVRLFVLKPEIQKSAQAQFYQQILDQINTWQHHYDASFKKSKRRRYNHRYNYDLPRLSTIDGYHWRLNKAELSDAQRECFKQVPYWDVARYRWAYRYEFAYPELFKIAVQPHLVTTIKVRDMDMEKRIDFIDDYLEKSGQQYRLGKLKDRSYSYWGKNLFEQPKYVNRLRNKSRQDWARLDEGI
ncbi:hypothetical protein [Mucilaginibacter sp.]